MCKERAYPLHHYKNGKEFNHWELKPVLTNRRRSSSFTSDLFFYLTQKPKSQIFLFCSSMASNKLLHAKREKNSFIFVSQDADFNSLNTPENLFDFDEADVWNNSNNSSGVSAFEAKKIIPSSRPLRKGGRNMVVERTSRSVNCAASLPVNIPDWSKIYREDNYTRHHKQNDDQDQDQDSEYDGDHDHGGDDEDERIPPHEYLARRRGASFSVHEGIGRTLKGRDLRQVRNAIWKKVGFED